MKTDLHKNWITILNKGDRSDQQWELLSNYLKKLIELYIPRRTGTPQWKNKGKFPLDKKCLAKKEEKAQMLATVYGVTKQRKVESILWRKKSSSKYVS